MIRGRLSFIRGDETICSYSSRKTESALERMRGLLFAPPIVHEEALLIAPCNSVHTLFMKFSIDVAYLDKQHQVKHLVSKLAPWRASFFLSASSVIEMAAGEIEKNGIQIGDICLCQD